MAQNSGYYRFPLATNDRGTIQPLLGMAPQFQAEEEGPPTKQELILGATHIFSLPHYIRLGRIGCHHLAARFDLLPQPEKGSGIRSSHLEASVTG
jgi:hypothetical protein